MFACLFVVRLVSSSSAEFDERRVEVKRDKRMRDEFGETFLEVGKDLYVYKPMDFDLAAARNEGWSLELNEQEGAKEESKSRERIEFVSSTLSSTIASNTSLHETATTTTTTTTLAPTFILRALKGEKSWLVSRDEQVVVESAQANEESAYKTKTLCVGSEDSSKSFNWICKGLNLTLVPAQLRPDPMSL